MFYKFPNYLFYGCSIYDDIKEKGVGVYTFLLYMKNIENRVITTKHIIYSYLNFGSNSTRNNNELVQILQKLKSYNLINMVEDNVIKAKKNDIIEIEILNVEKWFKLYKEDFEVLNYSDKHIAVFLFICSYINRETGYASLTTEFISSSLAIRKQTVSQCICDLNSLITVDLGQTIKHIDGRYEKERQKFQRNKLTIKEI